MSRSPYLSSAPSVSVIMVKVMLALIPAIAAYVWVYGAGILVTLALASTTALVAEALMLKLRNRPIKPFLMDGSALLTALLLAIRQILRQRQVVLYRKYLLARARKISMSLAPPTIHWPDRCISRRTTRRSKRRRRYMPELVRPITPTVTTAIFICAAMAP